MAFYFPPTRSVTSAARLQYLQILQSTQEQNTPSPSSKVPDIPKPAAAPSFRKIRAKISRKRHRATDSLKSDSSSGITHIDRPRESHSTSSSEGTASSAASYPETNSDPSGLRSSTLTTQTQDALSVDVKEVDLREDEDEKAPIIWDNTDSISPERAFDDRSASAQRTKNNDIFRACANLLTHPFTYNFTIDPSKLNSSSALLSILQAGSPSRLQEDQLRILDLGGRISDKYARNIEQATHVTVIKAVQGESGRELANRSSRLSFAGLPDKISTATQFKDPLPLILEDLSRLPLPSGSVQAISARSLYKDMVTTTPRDHSLKGSPGPRWPTEDILRDCLRECHRVLSRRGIIEYIYFDREVENPGPLITEMEECFDSLSGNSGPGGSQFLSIEKFLDLLEDAGFAGGKSVVLKFPYTMLSKLFTKDGQRRASFPGQIYFLDEEDDSRRFSNGQFGRREVDYDATRRLFTGIEKEATLLNSSWKCVVGWAVKTSRRR